MMRGTFANIRIKNEMLGGKEGGNTIYVPTGEEMSIYDASMKYQAQGTPLVVFAGKEYGTGSSRDWAAKGTKLLGIRAVIAESFERIHRSNLVGMGIIPLEFRAGEDRKTLGITGKETVDIDGLDGKLKPRATMKARITYADGTTKAVASIRSTRSSISRMAASCSSCCATSSRRRNVPGDGSQMGRIARSGLFCGHARHHPIVTGR